MRDNPYRPPSTAILDEPVAEPGSFRWSAPRQGIVVVLGVNVALAVINLLFLALQDEMLSEALLTGDLDTARAAASDSRITIGASLASLAFVAGALFWGFWSVAAAKNLRALHPETAFEVPPGWTIGWFFVPFLNLVQPYKATREIYVWSRTRDNDSPAESAIVGWWWLLWIVNNIFAQVTLRLAPSDSPTLEGLLTAGRVGMVSDLLTLATAAAALVMIRRINAGQWRLRQPDAPGRSDWAERDAPYSRGG